MQERIALYLASRMGFYVRADELIDVAYRDARDGGPLDAKKSIDVRIFHLKRKLARVGLSIEGELGRNSGGRRLVWAAVAEAAA